VGVERRTLNELISWRATVKSVDDIGDDIGLRADRAQSYTDLVSDLLDRIDPDFDFDYEGSTGSDGFG